MLVPEQRTAILGFVRKHASARVTPNGQAETPDVYFKVKHGPSVGKSQGVLAPVYASSAEDVESLAILVCDHVTDSYVGAGEPARMWLTVFAVGDKSPHSFICLDFEDGRTQVDDAVAQLQSAANIKGDSMSGATALIVLETNKLLRSQVSELLETNRQLTVQVQGQHDELVGARAKLVLADLALQWNGEARARARVDALVEKGGPFVDKWVPLFLATVTTLGTGYLATRAAPGSDKPPGDVHEAADWHIDHAVSAVVAMGLHFQANPATLTKAREARLTQMVQQFMTFAAEMSKPDAPV